MHGADRPAGFGTVAVEAGDLGPVLIAALVGADDPEAGGLADDARGRAASRLDQFLKQDRRPVEAVLLVEGQRDVDRALEVEDRIPGGQRQHAGDEALHVGCTPPVDPVSTTSCLEGRRGPVGGVDGDDVGVAREHDAAVDVGTDGGEQIGPAPGLVVREDQVGAERPELVLDVSDEVDVGGQGDGRESDQVIEDSQGLIEQRVVAGHRYQSFTKSPRG